MSPKLLPPVPTVDDLTPHLARLEADERDSILRVMRKDKILRCNSTGSYGSMIEHAEEDKRDMLRGDYERFVSDKFENLSAASSRRNSQISERDETDDRGFEDVEVPDSGLMSEIERLPPEERDKIMEVMRRDTVVKLYTDLKVR